jgi:hypothetical protein
MSTAPRPIPGRPDETPRPGPAGPRTPYPVNDPGFADPNKPGSDQTTSLRHRQWEHRNCRSRQTAVLRGSVLPNTAIASGLSSERARLSARSADSSDRAH